MSTRRLDDGEVAAAATRYVQGESVPPLAAELGVAPSTLYNRLHKAGVAIRLRGGASKPITPEVRAEIVTRRASGLSAIKIAKKFGVSRSTVYRVIGSRNAAARSGSRSRRGSKA